MKATTFLTLEDVALGLQLEHIKRAMELVQLREQLRLVTTWRTSSTGRGIGHIEARAAREEGRLRETIRFLEAKQARSRRARISWPHHPLSADPDVSGWQPGRRTRW
jgi:hypothetical protein